ncbi:histone-lysine n-methyltransferase setdb2 [Limosa lapponica baueri]|uniref:Histone-lysine N-methyltransferase SETDB2 n=1 Tax=Limosa lapponica baueri TaxID=1758121 RepID=A0A2I0TJC1_LIMLA|nr:histone-lysine n-methyltransferase setdb2 [Limosa lapponica baueri]
MEKTGSEGKEASGKIEDLPLNLQYKNHKCSSACLANRAAGSFKGENPLKIPILFHFQRRHAKADCLSKSLDVSYKAPCGRSLRNFQDVQNYLFETECNFLFVDHFSFNTYVLLGRNTVNPEPLVFDFDISNGAESVPISFCNDLDRARLPYFKYRRASWPRAYYLNNFSSMFVDSCDCTDGCIDRLMSRDEVQVLGDGGQELKGKSAEIDTLVHSASSDEDNSSQIHQSSKTKLTSGRKEGKEKPTQQQKEEHPMEIGQAESASMDSAECKRKSLSLQGVGCGKSGVLRDTCVVRPSKNAALKADCKEDNHRQSKQDAFCEEADGDRTLLKNANEESVYVLDATKEGNVGRFLNHSCCPNLFAQSVFVETHNRSFPWVAFFTNSTRLLPEPVRTPGTVDSTFSLFLTEFPEPSELDPLTGPEQGLCICIDSSFPAPAVFQIMAKMLRRTCAFCPDREAGSVMYIAEEQDIAAHQDCLLFSSGFVESEDYNPENLDIRFDVASVLKELKRGKRLVCNFCRKKGATVGCEERACRRSYHYFCALCDDAAIETDEVNGVYRVFCPKHDPGNRTNQYVRIDFLRKCKQAGLLDDIFEEMLDTLHLAQEKLMDDNTSETGTEEKIQELLESRKRLDSKIELLQDLKGVVLPTPENTASTSSTVSD